MNPAKSVLRAGMYATLRFLVRIILVPYNRVERRGIDPAVQKAPLAIVSNHVSNLDPVFIGAIHPRAMYFLSKKELFSTRIGGAFLRMINLLPIDRHGLDRAALQAAVRTLKNGHELLLFPEGTRSRDGELGPGKPGVGMIAAMAGVKCLPVFVEGTGRAMPVGARFIRPRKVTVTYGEPFELPARSGGTSSKEHYQMCADLMMSRIADLRTPAPAGAGQENRPRPAP